MNNHQLLPYFFTLAFATVFVQALMLGYDIAGMRELKSMFERDVLLPLHFPALYAKYRVPMPADTMALEREIDRLMYQSRQPVRQFFGGRRETDARLRPTKRDSGGQAGGDCDCRRLDSSSGRLPTGS